MVYHSRIGAVGTSIKKSDLAMFQFTPLYIANLIKYPAWMLRPNVIFKVCLENIMHQNIIRPDHLPDLRGNCIVPFVNKNLDTLSIRKLKSCGTNGLAF